MQNGWSWYQRGHWGRLKGGIWPYPGGMDHRQVTAEACEWLRGPWEKVLPVPAWGCGGYRSRTGSSRTPRKTGSG